MDFGLVKSLSIAGKAVKTLMLDGRLVWKEGGAWTNPYITDGLLGMWDAEWNEAGGVHNPELMQLNDLTGNLGSFPVFELGAKWAKRNSATTFGASEYPKISELVNSDGDSVRTFDSCHSFDSQIGTVSGIKYALNCTAVYDTSVSGTTASVINGGGVYSDGYLFVTRGAFQFFRTTITPRYDGVVTLCVGGIHGSSDGVFVNGYIDGEKIGEATPSRLSYALVDVRTLTFSAPGSTYAQLINTHCIRLYSRVLTPDEVAHNARIDRDRFGGVQ